METCNLDYLKSHSPNNPKFVVIMLQMFLAETPTYIAAIKKSIFESDWDVVYGNVHKMRPSIDLIGMPKEIGILAKKIEEDCKERKNLDQIADLFIKVEETFKLAYVELEEELKRINANSN